MSLAAAATRSPPCPATGAACSSSTAACLRRASSGCMHVLSSVRAPSTPGGSLTPAVAAGAAAGAAAAAAGLSAAGLSAAPPSAGVPLGAAAGAGAGVGLALATRAAQLIAPGTGGSGGGEGVPAIDQAGPVRSGRPRPAPAQHAAAAAAAAERRRSGGDGAAPMLAAGSPGIHMRCRSRNQQQAGLQGGQGWPPAAHEPASAANPGAGATCHSESGGSWDPCHPVQRRAPACSAMVAACGGERHCQSAWRRMEWPRPPCRSLTWWPAPCRCWGPAAGPQPPGAPPFPGPAPFWLLCVAALCLGISRAGVGLEWGTLAAVRALGGLQCHVTPSPRAPPPLPHHAHCAARTPHSTSAIAARACATHAATLAPSPSRAPRSASPGPHHLAAGCDSSPASP